MSKSKSIRRKRKRRRILRVPKWYYALLVAIALVGGGLIAFSVRPPEIDTGGLTPEGDYVLGDPNAPVTMIEWAQFQ